MHIDILTLFPDMFSSVFNESILKKARDNEKFTYNLLDFRNFSTNRHHKVDDYPYGGGAGMVLTPQPIFDAVESLIQNGDHTPRIILMCPQGERYRSEERRVGKDDP